MQRAAIAMAALALTLVACGDDGEPEAATTTTRRIVIESGTATTTTGPATVVTTTVPASSECATVGFTPDSEDAASDIRATGLPCAEAESFVRKAGQVTSSGGPQEVDVDGYHCVRTGSLEDPLPRSFYECTNGPRTVSFVRS